MTLVPPRPSPAAFPASPGPHPQAPEPPLETLFAAVHARIAAAVADLASSQVLQGAVEKLVVTLPEEPPMLAVPLHVHGAHTGRRSPAVPVSAIHVLWWVAAHVFDDFIDEAPTDYDGTLSSGESLMAAVVCGSALPARIAVEDYPEIVVPPLLHDFQLAWILSNDGQIRDLNGNAAATSRDEVLTTYRHKNGAPYGMACALAARVAGVDEARIQLWSEFGTALGQLGQFRNDQEDLQTSRDEDLRNGTATYLVAHLLDLVDEDERDALRRLLAEAAGDPSARTELRRRMLAPSTLTGYFAEVERLRTAAYDRLERIGVEGPDVDALRAIVDDAAAPLPLFADLRATLT